MVQRSAHSCCVRSAAPSVFSKLPAKWSLDVEQNGVWSPMDLYVTDEYGLHVNQFNVVRPAAPLEGDAIRLNMTPQPDACVGVLEIDVTLE